VEPLQYRLDRRFHFYMKGGANEPFVPNDEFA
jgi:hypothetical protein